MNYLDFLPRELLAYLIPIDYVYTALQVFKDQDRYQIFVNYINYEYPDYFRIYKRNNSSFDQIMTGLLYFYTYYKIDDINLNIEKIKIEMYGGSVNCSYDFDWLYPIILIMKYPKVIGYYLKHELIEGDYTEKLDEDKFNHRDLFRDLAIIALFLDINDFRELIAYEMSDKFKITLLKLLDIDLTKHSISTDDLDEIMDTDLGLYLISKKINLW
jgi:hypothetical protein